MGAALLGGVVAVGLGQTFDSGSTTTVIREIQSGTTEPAAFPSNAGKKISDIYEGAKHGVVQVTSTSVVSSSFFGAQEQQAQGSGFVIDKDGHAVLLQRLHLVDLHPRASCGLLDCEAAAKSGGSKGRDGHQELRVRRKARATLFPSAFCGCA